MEPVYVLVIEDLDCDSILCASTDRGVVDSAAKDIIPNLREDQALIVQIWRYGELAEEDILVYAGDNRLYLKFRIRFSTLVWTPLLALLAYSVYLAFF